MSSGNQEPVMFPLSPSAKIFVYSEATNMRKSFEGLCRLVEKAFSTSPISDSFFIFINRRRDSMKILYWDLDGLAIWYIVF